MLRNFLFLWGFLTFVAFQTVFSENTLKYDAKIGENVTLECSNYPKSNLQWSIFYSGNNSNVMKVNDRNDTILINNVQISNNNSKFYCEVLFNSSILNATSNFFIELHIINSVDLIKLPENITLKASANSVLVSWVPNNDSISYNISLYKNNGSEMLTSVNVNNSMRQYEFIKLQPLTNYSVEMSVVTNDNSISSSPLYFISTLIDITKYLDVNVSVGENSAIITIICLEDSWQIFNTLKLEIKETNDDKSIDSLNVTCNKTENIVNNLKPASNYTIYLPNFNKLLLTTFVTTTISPPNPPTIQTTIFDLANFSLEVHLSSWEWNNGNESDTLSYHVQLTYEMKEIQKVIKKIQFNSSLIIFYDVKPNQEYLLTASACKKDICSIATNKIINTTHPAPSAPKIISILTNNTGVFINWTKSTISQSQEIRIPHSKSNIIYKICWFIILSQHNKTTKINCIYSQNVDFNHDVYCKCSPEELNHSTFIPWSILANLTKNDNNFDNEMKSLDEYCSFPWFMFFNIYAIAENIAHVPILFPPNTTNISIQGETITYFHSCIIWPRSGDSILSLVMKLFGIIVFLFLLSIVAYIVWRKRILCHLCHDSQFQPMKQQQQQQNHYYKTRRLGDGIVSMQETVGFLDDHPNHRPRNHRQFSTSHFSSLFSKVRRNGGSATVGGGNKKRDNKSTSYCMDDSSLSQCIISFADTPHSPISLNNFPAYVARMHLDDDQGFLTEFENINRATRNEWPMTTSALPENIKRNRYSNISAFDHSRVCLGTTFGKCKNDYINANFIDGYHREHAFIATQGPLESTCNHFWQMVWEQQTNIIVMISHFVERGRRKCDPYWSPNINETKHYGPISVRLLEETELIYYTLRIFHVHATHKSLFHGKKTEKDRIVYHYHYTDWQDMDVPRSPLPVLSFIRHSQVHWTDLNGPIVVHCSAGVGRTGTYICIDALIRQMEKEKQVNIRGFLEHIRQQRMKLVQTEQQYAFIHDALREFMVCPHHETTLENYSDYVKQLKQTTTTTTLDPDNNNPPHSSTALHKQFQLCVEFQAPNFWYNEARKACNINKNHSSLLPVEFSRVKLPGDIAVEGSNYINASHIQGFFAKCNYIITQHPHPANTEEEDFWKMIWNENCSIVIVLSSTERGVFWPEEKGQTKTVGLLKVTSRGPVLLSTSEMTQCTSATSSTPLDNGTNNSNNHHSSQSFETIVCYEFLLSSSREDYALVTRLCPLSHLWRERHDDWHCNDSPRPDDTALLHMMHVLTPPGHVAARSIQDSNNTCETSSHQQQQQAHHHHHKNLFFGKQFHNLSTLSTNDGSDGVGGGVGSSAGGDYSIGGTDPLNSIHTLAQGLLDSGSSNVTMVLVDDLGGSRAGRFCALSILIQQCLFHQMVDVYLVVKMLHLQRPGMFTDSNDLAYIYNTLQDFLNHYGSKCIKQNPKWDIHQLLARLPSSSPSSPLLLDSSLNHPIKRRGQRRQPVNSLIFNSPLPFPLDSFPESVRPFSAIDAITKEEDLSLA